MVFPRLELKLENGPRYETTEASGVCKRHKNIEFRIIENKIYMVIMMVLNAVTSDV